MSRAYQEGEVELLSVMLCQACQEYPPHHNWGSSVGFVGNAVPAAEGAEPELAVEDVELAVEGAESAVEGAELAAVSLGRCAGAETDNKSM